MLEELKKRLKITWNDEDDNFKRSLEAGKEYLEHIAGTTLDFEGSSFNMALLFEYCRYDYNNAIEYFEMNFQRQLTQLQIQSVVQENDK
ncbi:MULTISPECIES: phage gp6-like head-tail connector protein [Clostridium]|uniref:Phage gp6-like head-tail connector protein n=2 Tax=Clostridium TaxID=1485 RepID=A0ABN1LJL5_9CLOT|nr:phage gp6-like head-tail connector protein [Clostridium baratii]CUP72870.1 Gp6 protein [Clostridium baratii]